MLGCNESNIIFQQHLCKLGQLRRSNGRNSQVFGQAMKKRPTVTVRRMTKYFCTALPIHLRVQYMFQCTYNTVQSALPLERGQSDQRCTVFCPRQPPDCVTNQNIVVRAHIHTHTHTLVRSNGGRCFGSFDDPPNHLPSCTGCHGSCRPGDGQTIDYYLWCVCV